MKKYITFILLAFIAGTSTAYDFEHEGILYKFNPKHDNSVIVTCLEQNEFTSPDIIRTIPENHPTEYEKIGPICNINARPFYKGTVTVPSTVTYGGKTYEVTEIGNSAFAYSHELTGIILPPTITKLGQSAFWNCTGLKEIDIPEGVKEISHSCFFDSGITEFNLPASIEFIGEVPFGFYVTKVTFNHDNSTAEGVPTIHPYAFDMTIRLQEITLPKSNFKLFGQAFGENLKLQKIIFPDIVKASAEDDIFHSCPSLTEIVCMGENPPMLIGCNYLSHDREIYERCRLIVPESSVELYKNAKIWKDFTTITGVPDINDYAHIDQAGTLTPVIDITTGAGAIDIITSSPVKTSVYDLRGVIVYQGTVSSHLTLSLPTGAYLVKCHDRTLKVRI